MSKDWYQDVLDFHEKFGVYVNESPSFPPTAVEILRIKLMAEEFGETCDAISAGDLPEIADGLADLIYVALGAAISWGIDLRPVWDEVHRSNMAKVGGGQRSDGKIGKPEGWVRPDIAGVLRAQGYDAPRS